jgi:hypothetical protein
MTEKDRPIPSKPASRPETNTRPSGRRKGDKKPERQPRPLPAHHLHGSGKRACQAQVAKLRETLNSTTAPKGTSDAPRRNSPTEFAKRVSTYFEEARQEAMSRTRRGDTIDTRGILVEWEQDAEADGEVVGQTLPASLDASSVSPNAT